MIGSLSLILDLHSSGGCSCPLVQLAFANGRMGGAVLRRSGKDTNEVSAICSRTTG